MKELLALAVKYGQLVVDALVTAFRAVNEGLSEEQIRAEVERIKRAAAEDKADDWQTVNS